MTTIMRSPRSITRSPSAASTCQRTIDGQDVANIGFFDRPRTDIESLPLRIAFNDPGCAAKV